MSNDLKKKQVEVITLHVLNSYWAQQEQSRVGDGEMWVNGLS